MIEYTFTKLLNLNKGTKKYILNWYEYRKDANGSEIENLVGHLKTQNIKINLEEDSIVGCKKQMQGDCLRTPPSNRDFQRFYNIGKEKGVVVG